MVRRIIFLASLLLLFVAAGCSAGAESPNPTEIVETVMAELTLTATAAATETPTVTPTDTVEPTQAATATLAVTATTGSALPAQTGAQVITNCDVAGFVSDITIPDGTELAPGSSFRKTWQLRNDGTCTWDAEYEVVFYSGEQMGGPVSQALTTGTVAPGGTVQVSVNLVAPTTDGTYYSYWILRNGSGQNFGLGATGDPFYVQIVVGDGGDSSGAAAPTSDAVEETLAPAVTDTPIGSTDG